VGSTDKEDLCLDTGHIGIYVSSKTQREFTPKILQWLTERDTPKKEMKVKKQPVPRTPKKAAKVSWRNRTKNTTRSKEITNA
jgi:polyhydroxyalkanoate synthase subunit PhaC